MVGARPPPPCAPSHQEAGARLDQDTTAYVAAQADRSREATVTIRARAGCAQASRVATHAHEIRDAFAAINQGAIHLEGHEIEATH
jgi:hypothetical protein